MSTTEELKELYSEMKEIEYIEKRIMIADKEFDDEIEKLKSSLKHVEELKSKFNPDLKEIITDRKAACDLNIKTVLKNWDSSEKTIRVEDMNFTRKTSESVIVKDEPGLVTHCTTFPEKIYTTVIKWDKKAIKSLIKLNMIPQNLVVLEQKYSLIKKQVEV